MTSSRLSLPLIALASALLLVLAGCSARSSAMRDSLFPGLYASGAEVAPPDPNVRYLRVGHRGSAAYMMLGYVEPSDVGPLEAWYSLSGEVVQFRQGRIVGTAGLSTDWREVRLPPLPDWRAVPPAGVRYTREVDLMPAYRFGRRETLELRPVPPPADARLKRARAADLSWFVEAPVEPGPDTLPSSRYAVDLRQSPPRVVYSEQCISAALCFTFEDWPLPAAPAGGTAKPGGAS